ncbi:MAG: NAD-binding protein [Sulfurimonas sp.]|nr:NAD-binding protein [Sulfurimonas sp.]
MSNNSLWLILQKLRVPFLVLIIAYTIAILGLVMLDGTTSDGKPYNMTIFDAFYFITYTATTIGFGETPYTFTYSQRIWVSMIIYLTVIGWFYSVGSIISLLQDKVLIREIAKAKFKKQVRNLRENFLIILGYNATTKRIIEKSLHKGFRVVVIEKNEERVYELLMESYTPVVPVLQADIHDPIALEISGIKSKYCKGLISLFEDDSLNFRIAVTSKIINPKVPLAIKSTTETLTENLIDIGVEIIENPFEIISSQIHLSLNSPSIYQIGKWIYNLDILRKEQFKLPRGLYIVCGYGRMGREIYKVLKENNIEAKFIEINKEKVTDSNLKDVKIVSSYDMDLLKSLEIEKASVIIAGTKDDTLNLSLLSTARKINKNIVTVARENELENYSIFKYSHIDFIFMPSRILIHKTINALVNPMSDKFLHLMKSQTEELGARLVEELLSKIGDNPEVFELYIESEQANAIKDSIINNYTIYLGNLSLRRDDRMIKNSIKPLLLQRGKKFYLLPEETMTIKISDRILFAATLEAIEDIEYIAQNMYELEYVTDNFKTTQSA